MAKGMAALVFNSFLVAVMAIFLRGAIGLGHSPLLVGVVSSAVPGVLLWLTLCRMGRGYEPTRVGWLLPSLLLIGVLGTTIRGCNLFGLQLSTAANFGILGRTNLLFGILLGWTLLREKLHPTDGIGLAVMVIGVWLVVGRGASISTGTIIGDALFVAGGLFAAFNAIIIKVSLRRISEPSVALYNMAVRTVLFALISALQGRIACLLHLAADARALTLTIAAGITTWGAILAYYYALRTLPVWMVCAGLFTIPIFTVSMGAAFLHEAITWHHLVGMALLIMGASVIVALTQLRSR